MAVESKELADQLQALRKTLEKYQITFDSSGNTTNAGTILTAYDRGDDVRGAHKLSTYLERYNEVRKSMAGPLPQAVASTSGPASKP